ncbi:hypothetical protein [Mammaliicoccus sciuri]|uniref:hypothetical protein n=1 Tax=Mammaliicoccus sciuri TaxID=1296 RepID=UPI000CD3111F|nr:hypothetical protein [Mammaliicoccus sciuri]MEB7065886.1 hypothetical protein [Mammaliicoccus sciuri]PNZ26577.1 hypothetical protein CD114_07565 [Mammaliicoccus sciuri]UXU68200.1 hypothetical protein MUA36_09695 [Mammaliicoccus sciuri]
MLNNYNSVNHLIKKNNDSILNTFKNATSNLTSSKYFVTQKGRDLDNVINVIELPSFNQLLKPTYYKIPSILPIIEPPKINIPNFDIKSFDFNINFDISPILRKNYNSQKFSSDILENILDTSLLNNLANHNDTVINLAKNIRSDYVKSLGTIAIKELKPYDSELNRKLPTSNTNKKYIYGLLSDLFVYILENYIVELTHNDMTPLALILFKWGIIILLSSNE